MWVWVVIDGSIAPHGSRRAHGHSTTAGTPPGNGTTSLRSGAGPSSASQPPSRTHSACHVPVISHREFNPPCAEVTNLRKRSVVFTDPLCFESLDSASELL